MTSLTDRKIKRRTLVLRDRPFLVITALNGVLALSWRMIDPGIPLWISHHTHAPLWIWAVVIGISAGGTVLFQNRVSRWGVTVPAAARLGLWSGIALACSCVVFAFSHDGAGPVVVGVLVLAAIPSPRALARRGMRRVARMHRDVADLAVEQNLDRRAGPGDERGPQEAHVRCRSAAGSRCVSTRSVMVLSTGCGGKGRPAEHPPSQCAGRVTCSCVPGPGEDDLPGGFHCLMWTQAARSSAASAGTTCRCEGADEVPKSRSIPAVKASYRLGRRARTQRA